MKTQFKSIKSLISDVRENSGNSSVLEEKKVRKWGNDEVKSLMTADQFDKTVALIHIKNYVGKLPDNFKKVIQAGYGYADKKECSRESVAKCYKHIDGCKITVQATCPTCSKKKCCCPSPIVTYEVDPLDLANNPYLLTQANKSFYSYGKVGGAYVHGDCPWFTLMRPAVNNFHDKKSIGDCIPLDVGHEVTYEIDGLNLILNNVKDCKVLLSYHGWKMDSSGYLMIPDIPEVWTALTYTIDMRIAYARWTKERKETDERHFFALKKLKEEAAHTAKIKLNRLEPERFKALWMNFFGKQVPHYYADETFYEYVNDTFKVYK